MIQDNGHSDPDRTRSALYRGAVMRASASAEKVR